MKRRHATESDAGGIVAMITRIAEDSGDGARFSLTAETSRAHGLSALGAGAETAA